MALINVAASRHLGLNGLEGLYEARAADDQRRTSKKLLGEPINHLFRLLRLSLLGTELGQLHTDGSLMRL